MKRKFILFLSIVFLSLLVIAGCGSTGAETSSSEEIKKIKVVSTLAADHQYTKDIVPMWIDMIENEVEGVEIEWIGGPESIPQESLLSSVQSGIVDVAFVFGTDFRDELRVTESLSISPLTPSEERDIGYYDYVAEEFGKADVTYLGRWLGGFGYYLWTNEEINTLEDFKGLKIRSNPFYRSIINELGATPVNVSAGDVYTSLERNLVDGFAFPLLGPREGGWTEVTQYLINAEFAEQVSVILMNPDTFSSFTEEEREKIKSVTAEFEPLMVEYFEKENEKELQTVIDSGVTVLELPDKDIEKFQDLVYDGIQLQMEELLSDEEIKEIENFLLE